MVLNVPVSLVLDVLVGVECIGHAAMPVLYALLAMLSFRLVQLVP